MEVLVMRYRVASSPNVTRELRLTPYREGEESKAAHYLAKQFAEGEEFTMLVAYDKRRESRLRAEGTCRLCGAHREIRESVQIPNWPEEQWLKFRVVRDAAGLFAQALPRATATSTPTGTPTAHDVSPGVA